MRRGLKRCGKKYVFKWALKVVTDKATGNSRFESQKFPPPRLV